MRKTVNITFSVDLTLSMDDNLTVQEAMEEIEICQTPWHSKGCQESFKIDRAEITDVKVKEES